MIDPGDPRLSIVRQCDLVIGLAPIHQRPKTSEPCPRYKIYPYLLRHLIIEEPSQVWCTNVTYIPMRRGFLYLVAMMEWAVEYDGR
jgi:putative transposase